ncbi:hypothetical protein LCM4579_27365 [Ensifer sp. LCM 4579]|nr:hypothetical protein LCM4579_27365 [Ensifer sp. LCM 4579]
MIVMPETGRSRESMAAVTAALCQGWAEIPKCEQKRGSAAEPLQLGGPWTTVKLRWPNLLDQFKTI